MLNDTFDLQRKLSCIRRGGAGQVSLSKSSPSGRVAAKIFVFVFSRKFREIISFVFSEIFLQFREIFAKHEIKICAKFSRNSKEISRNTKQEITLTSFFKNSLPKSIKKCNFSENPK